MQFFILCLFIILFNTSQVSAQQKTPSSGGKWRNWPNAQWQKGPGIRHPVGNGPVGAPVVSDVPSFWQMIAIYCFKCIFLGGAWLGEYTVLILILLPVCFILGIIFI